MNKHDRKRVKDQKYPKKLKRRALLLWQGGCSLDFRITMEKQKRNIGSTKNGYVSFTHHMTHTINLQAKVVNVRLSIYDTHTLGTFWIKHEAVYCNSPYYKGHLNNLQILLKTRKKSTATDISQKHT